MLKIYLVSSQQCLKQDDDYMLRSLAAINYFSWKPEFIISLLHCIFKPRFLKNQF